jgi:hypothetical protein
MRSIHLKFTEDEFPNPTRLIRIAKNAPRYFVSQYALSQL